MSDSQIDDNAAVLAQRYTRRLSDKILIAVHHACDRSDFEVAERLLQTVGMLLVRRPLTPAGNRRHNLDTLVLAYERLWRLRHPVLNESRGLG